MKALLIVPFSVLFVVAFGDDARKIAQALPGWSVWMLVVATGVGMAAVQAPADVPRPAPTQPQGVTPPPKQPFRPPVFRRAPFL